MAENDSQDPAEAAIYGLAYQLVEAVAQADLTLHHYQWEAWKEFVASQPKLEGWREDLAAGFPEDRYMAMRSVKMRVHMRPRPEKEKVKVKKKRDGILGWFGATKTKTVTREVPPRTHEVRAFEFCSADAKNAQSIDITVERLNNGQVHANWEEIPFTKKENS